MSRKESLALSTLILLSILLAFAGGYLARELVAREAAELPLLEAAHRILIEHAYDPLPDGPQLEYGMIRGMVSAYGDPFTIFSEPVQHELQSDSLQGSFGGIGVSFERDAEQRVRLYPFPDGPAAGEGLRDGDILLLVDDLVIGAETPPETITAAIRGPSGSEVRITVLREPENEERVFEIQRMDVPLPSVTWRLSPDDGRIGLIEVNVIADSTPGEIERAAADLAEQGAEFYVLDLRGNGGGLLQAGVDCARLFLADGVVIQQQFKGEAVQTHAVERSGPLADLPLAVWVDHGTASAAEICAGALQSNGRAPLIGAPTFGKDVIQLVFELDDGSSIQVTAAKWWFPGFEFPNGMDGLFPNVSADEDADYIAETIPLLD
ncbi:MAG TPA: S41 family peptidase [Anaerolineales bacterium]|nr:S41 family peptidase [Anaerolineales bacterium]